ncbi:hypothetical protein GCL60_09760 [Silvanigrella paludirubra]|uniref:Thioesterase domain-containing protein n=1 Tax=Silvanigrella paludirubra TaxID=2499159 RepID=A0A6N6VTZ6_9BACT|nr:hotdog fold domain-containing protein [Silvanigrella paludirubra]KAB8039131.1 hypothetical protein GCL60_09760 [Silvanigrella paludirubra]
MNIDNLRKTIETWENKHNYKSYFSSLNNPYGLNAEPKIIDGKFILKYKIEKKHMGIPNFAFGGISFSLLDGLMGWFIMTNYDKIGITLTNTIKYYNPLILNETYIFETRENKKINNNTISLIGEVKNNDDILCVESKSIFLLKNELINF